MKHAPFRILLAALLVGLLAVGCSDSDDDKKDDETTTTVATSDPSTDDTTDTSTDASTDEKPSVDEISQGLQDGLGLDAAKADCVAAQLVDQLSTEALNAMATNDPDAMPAGELESAQAAAAAAAASC